MSGLLVVVGSSTKSIEEGIAKARRAFFAYGALRAFGGKLNPLSGKAIYETCVVPVLLYGCESWVLSDTSTTILESFQGEIDRRILRLSLFFPVQWLYNFSQSIICCKLNLLRRVNTETE